MSINTNIYNYQNIHSCSFLSPTEVVPPATTSTRMPRPVQSYLVVFILTHPLCHYLGCVEVENTTQMPHLSSFLTWPDPITLQYTLT